ncbi:hypothetical protein EYF80_010542 [Liparis tanakae]|uniref:Uncharacterized protein n=1 Tax=Liparis tanakae TaxID=230148 RepID=A0A4Z2INE6_9TELE|nr:hypothetical protein EYF80_010542 [Liparis tanakae]
MDKQSNCNLSSDCLGFTQDVNGDLRGASRVFANCRHSGFSGERVKQRECIESLPAGSQEVGVGFRDGEEGCGLSSWTLPVWECPPPAPLSSVTLEEPGVVERLIDWDSGSLAEPRRSSTPCCCSASSMPRLSLP